MASTRGRQVVLPLTNKSGGAVAAGDVVVIDTSNNEAFTTSTAGAVTGGVGIAQEAIANNATGRVLVHGYAALVNVNASVTRGNYGKTHTVAKQATDAGASRVAGAFCQFLTGGTTPTARVYSPDLGAAAGNVAADAIWDAAGDLAVGSGADTAAKLAKGSALQTLRVNAGATNLEWAATLGAWTDFTPTITAGGGGFSLGNGILQGRYKLLDANTAQISIFYQRGSTTNNGTGAYSIALPVTAKITKPQVQVLHGYFLDSGTMYYVATGYIINNTASVGTIIVADSGSVHEWSATNPAVPATGDELALSGIIEI